jgi:PPOX class probable F420-dependent enzyme
MLNDAARQLLESDALAPLVTLNADGSPQVSCVWAGLDGDEIVLASRPRRIKVTNVERDPRVSLSMQSPTRNDCGLDEYLIVHGTARVTEGGGPEPTSRWTTSAASDRGRADRGLNRHVSAGGVEVS